MSKLGYNETVRAIKDAPMTWLPALIKAATETAVEKKVFREGEMLEALANLLPERERGKVGYLMGPPESMADLERELKESESAHGNTIDQRDAAEEALSQAYFLVIGESPEWSNIFGYSHVVKAIDDAQSLLRQTINNHAQTLTTLKLARDALEKLLNACLVADSKEELPDDVDGSYLDTAKEALTAIDKVLPKEGE